MQRLRVGSRDRDKKRDATAHVVRMGKKKKASQAASTIPATIELPTLLTKEQLAEYFGVSPRTVEKWRFEGTGPKGIKVGKHVRWTVQSVQQYILEQLAHSA